MSRGKLDKETAENIDESLPSVHDIRISSLNLRPEFISIGFPPKSQFPVAAICLQDATSSLCEARYALLEALMNIEWFREKCKPSNEQQTIFFGKFYIDDATLRMFAVKEHLTNAVVNMLELSEQDLKHLRNTIKRVDDLTRIGNNLKNKSPNHSLVKPIFKLINSTDWKKARKYRNDWVHNKPPMIKGLGINYKRENRLIVTFDSIGVTLGKGDEAELSVDELLAFVKSAFFSLVELATEIVNYFIEHLNKNQRVEF